MEENSFELEISDLACTRGYRELFNGINVTVSAGQVLLVEGKNGSGKTSFIRIISGLVLPSQGEVKWEGLNIFKYRSEYQQAVSYIGHRNGTKAHLTPMENLLLDPNTATTSKDAAKSALSEVGLDGFEDQQCCNLSAGQNRRVALARALVARTQLWILDEPLTSVDAAGITLLEELYSNHIQLGGSIIMATHQSMNLSANGVKHLDIPTTTLTEERFL
ncbi:MAG: cytochrome c biogenesis heme-transporting ATPase CcmA [Arenicellales bacterium]|jgi:heme exporter protein A|nr:cytochrome c biogenesis heme-transporting ATPase CcmA [Arenicellales bacterium]